MHYGYGMGYPFWGGFILDILFWTVIIGAVIFIVVRLSHHDPHRRYSHAIEILEERFARGEIDMNEYEQRKQILLQDQVKK